MGYYLSMHRVDPETDEVMEAFFIESQLGNMTQEECIALTEDKFPTATTVHFLNYKAPNTKIEITKK